MTGTSRSDGDPFAASAGSRSRQLIETNGIRMYAHSRGSGRPVVFIHGLGWDHSLWDGAAQSLAAHYHTVTADTRGHGRSDKPEGAYSIDEFSHDWRGLLTGLRIERVSVVGFSLGGMIAMKLALEHPELVEALVLVSTLCRADSGLRDKLEARIETAKREDPVASARLGARQIFSPSFMLKQPEYIESFVGWRAAMNQEPLFAAARASYGFDVCARLGEIRVPSLVMYAEEDVITPPTDGERVVASLPAPEVVRFSGTGHMIPVEKPVEFETALSDFFARCYPPVPT